MKLEGQPILTSAGIRALDARLERAGLLELAMEEAGRTLADAAAELAPVGEIVLLAGSGANGGDALVAARHLHGLRREVRVLALPSKHPLTRLNRRRLQAVGVPVTLLQTKGLPQRLRGAALIVDGLLGTGFTPPLRPPLTEIVDIINRSDVPVLAADLPSGLQAEVSEVAGSEISGAVKAARTLALSGLKPALLFGEAASHAGGVTVSSLRSPPEWIEAHAVASRPTDRAVAALLPVRGKDTHKGTAGKVWVIGGHAGTLGAPVLAGQGALRAGAGLVTLHSEADLPLSMPELMAQRHADLAQFLGTVEQRPDAVCIGMGLGPQAAELARQVLGWGIPAVLDADALQPELLGAGHEACIWTPHPAEAARLLGVQTSELTRDPISAARALQTRSGGTVIFKGGPTTIAHAGGVWVSRGGHPGMASAGMGDTLAGILAALLGQGMSAPTAALAGVTLHARAGERAAAKHGYGLSASDVSAELGAAWLALTGA